MPEQPQHIKTVSIAGKFSVVVTLLVWVVNFFTPVIDESVSSMVFWIGPALFGSHLLEMVIFKRKIASSRNKANDMLQMLVFGYFHTMTMVD
ncbi:MAG: hypothetical protein KDI30_10035 [Pseudomonadales bacterium]|nr:hypothetical protein [Pseudomonadales bacterium]